MDNKDLYPLLDSIPQNRLPEVKVYLEGISLGKTNMDAYLDAAPYDDDEFSEEELASFEEAHQEYLRGETLSQEEIERRFDVA